MDAPVLKVRRTGRPFRLRRAPAERAWMDGSDERYAYRCLPLSIASQLGWEVLCPADLAVMWNGGKTKHDIVVGYRRPDAPQPCISHFGEGVVTFNLGALFTTNPGWQLQIRGPVNRPKRGVTALEGVVETEWLPFTSTMNWQVTEPGRWIPFEVASRSPPSCRCASTCSRPPGSSCSTWRTTRR